MHKNGEHFTVIQRPHEVEKKFLSDRVIDGSGNQHRKKLSYENRKSEVVVRHQTYKGLGKLL